MSRGGDEMASIPADQPSHPKVANQDVAGTPNPPPFASTQAAVRRNAISAYVPLVASTLLGIFLTPVFVRALSHEDFGVWSIGLGLVSYLGILDAGVGTAIATRVGHAVEDRARIERISRTATAIFVLMGVLCVALGSGLAAFVPSILGINDPQDVGQVRVMIVLLAIWQAFNLMLAVPSGVLQGTGRYSAFALFGALSALVVGFGQAAAAVLTHEIAWVAAATTLGGLATFGMLHATARSRAPGYLFSFRGADRRTALSLFGLGWRNSVIFIAGTAGYGSDIIIVGVVTGARGAAVYAIASRAGSFAITLGLRATQSMTGSYATLSGMHQYGQIWTLYKLGVQISLMVYLPLAVALVAFGRDLLTLWVGTLGSSSYPVLLAVVASGVFQVAGQNAFTLVMATEQGDRILKLSIASSLANVALSVYLTIAIGPAGAALGSLITAALVDGVGVPLVASRICNVRARTVLPAVASVLMPLLLAALAAGAFRAAVGHSGFVAVLGSILTVGAFVVGCVSTRARRQAMGEIAGRRARVVG